MTVGSVRGERLAGALDATGPGTADHPSARPARRARLRRRRLLRRQPEDHHRLARSSSAPTTAGSTRPTVRSSATSPTPRTPGSRNDHPSDKATFTFRVTVPERHKVIANGDLVSTHTARRHSTYVWNETSPMATYLATVDIGKWIVPHRAHAARHPRAGRRRPRARRRGDARAGSSSVTGDDHRLLGARVRPVRLHLDRRDRRQRAGRRVLPRDPDPPALRVRARPGHDGARARAPVVRRQRLGAHLARHLAQRGLRHVRRALWAEHTGGDSTYTAFSCGVRRSRRRTRSGSSRSPTRSATRCSPRAVYDRGGMTLAALRHRIGDRRSSRCCRPGRSSTATATPPPRSSWPWPSRCRTEDLRAFFRIWLATQAKPASFDAG